MKDKWISVKDKLPEDPSCVLAYGNMGKGHFYETVTFDNVEWVGQCFTLDTEALITHWMPLPEPPK